MTPRPIACLPALFLLLSLPPARATAQGPAPTPGPNVNVISGPDRDGDWTMQRQNEPAVACSSRNPLTCVAVGNDYRAVDIPFPPDDGRVIGDAWPGLYTTTDGGQTWRTGLLPGFPQDDSRESQASPLHVYEAGADPVVRPGAAGLFFYSGIVFDRGPGGKSAVFVARLIDNNNEAGNDAQPVALIDTQLVASAPGGAEGVPFIDKPWLAVDVPRDGRTCPVGGGASGIPTQDLPCARLYLTYSVVEGVGAAQRSTVMVTFSADSGGTWATPRPLSVTPSPDIDEDGIVTQRDLDVVRASLGRSCGSAKFNPVADLNRDCTVNILDQVTVSRRFGAAIPPPPRLHQGSVIAIDPSSGRVWVAWREFETSAGIDAISVATSSTGGVMFSPPGMIATFRPFDQGTTETSFRTNAFPTMTVDGAGRAYVAWSARGFATARPDPLTGDARVVISSSTDGVIWTAPQAVDDTDVPGHQLMPSLTFAAGRLQLAYYDLREDVSELFQQYVDELPILQGFADYRHTMEVWAAQAVPGPEPTFATIRITEYLVGELPDGRVERLQFSPPNLELFQQGTAPFMGDYIDVSPAESIVPTATGWAFNTAATRAPVFHVAWTDNRDVRPPTDGDWRSYTPPNPPEFARPTQSGFDPGQSVPPCVPGRAGMRNQNIYTSRLSSGLVVGSPENAKPLDEIPRDFVVFVQNNTTDVRHYRLAIIAPGDVSASFLQFSRRDELDVSVPPFSTVARTVFARGIETRRIDVTVHEITAAPGGDIVPGGQQGLIVLNPDPSNPRISNPRISNPRISNPDLASPRISNPPISNPRISNEEVHNPDLSNPRISNPRISNPRISNLDVDNPRISNAVIVNPDILNPRISNADIANPRISNPRISNPRISNADPTTAALTDTVWTVTNAGNTTTAYTVKLLLNREVPDGFATQLIAHRIYATPTVMGCDLTTQVQNVLLANILDPEFPDPSTLTDPDLENPRISNLTLALAPGESANVTLRVLDPDRFDEVRFEAVEAVALVAVAQAVNTVDVEAGRTQPPVAAILATTDQLPVAAEGASYSGRVQAIIDGTWEVAGGELPPGLTLGRNGQISGTATGPGTLTFLVKFTSTTGIIDYQSRTITVAAQLADLEAAVETSDSAAAPGAEVVFTVRVRNRSAAPADGVVVTTTLSDGSALLKLEPPTGATCFVGMLSVCELGTLAGGAEAEIVVRASRVVEGVLELSAAIDTASGDPNPVNDGASASTVVAAARIWIADESGFWDDTTKWSGGVVPAEGDAVLIDRPGGVVVTVRTPVSIASLAALDHVAIAGGSLVVASSARLGGGLTLSSGSLSTAGDLSLGGTSLWTGGQISGTGDIVVMSGATLRVSSPGQAGVLVRSVVNRGTLNWNQASLTLTNGVSITNAATGVLEIETSLPITGVAPSALVNAGVLRKSGPLGPLTLAGVAFETAGTLVVHLGVTDNDRIISDATTVLSGTLDVRLADGVVPAPGRTFEVVEAGTRTGTFATIIGNGIDYTATYTVAGLTLTVAGDGGGPGVFTVTNTNDSGPGSLRQAILDANAHPNGSTRDGIAFEIPGLAPFSINLASPLPSVTDPVVLDATTQSGWSGQPIVELNVAGAGVSANGLVVTAGNSLVRGLVINRAPGAGAGIVLAQAGGNVVEGCYLGTSIDGDTALGNDIGILVQSSGNRIGGLTPEARTVISGNRQVGIAIQGVSARENTVQGSFVGTNAAGTAPLGNANGGIRLASSASLNTLGGDVPASRNVISGNLLAGVAVLAANAVGNVIAGNYVGTDVTGTVDLGNGSDGILGGGSETIIRNNVISGNGDPLAGVGNGIVLNFANSSAIIQGNRIGTDATGMVPLPNFGSGIVATTAGHRIGGAALTDANLISGNAEAGVSITGPAATGNVVQGNLIGVNADRSGPLANGADGVSIADGASNNSIGGFVGAGNFIAFNLGSGIRVAAGTGNRILSNRIERNGALGIDLGNDGATPNDGGDFDSGPNNLQNTPVITEANFDTNRLSGRLTLASTPDTTFIVEIFHNTACDITGHGEGETLLDTTVVRTGSSGDGSLDFGVFNSNLATGVITATATDPEGNTSEFSPCATVTQTNQAPELVSVAPGTGQQGQTLDVTVTGQFTHFAQGATTADLGEGITVNSVTVLSATVARVTISIGDAAAGVRTVRIATGEEVVSLDDAFTVEEATPGVAVECGDLMAGEIAVSGEIDQLTFAGQAGDRVTLTLGAGGFPSFVTATATVVAPGGTALVTFSANSQQQLTLPETGTYVVQVRASNFVSTGAYTLGRDCQ